VDAAHASQHVVTIGGIALQTLGLVELAVETSRRHAGLYFQARDVAAEPYSGGRSEVALVRGGVQTVEWISDAGRALEPVQVADQASRVCAHSWLTSSETRADIVGQVAEVDTDAEVEVVSCLCVAARAQTVAGLAEDAVRILARLDADRCEVATESVLDRRYGLAYHRGRVVAAIGAGDAALADFVVLPAAFAVKRIDAAQHLPRGQIWSYVVWHCCCCEASGADQVEAVL